MDQRANTLKISKDTARLPLLRQHNWLFHPQFIRLPIVGLRALPLVLPPQFFIFLFLKSVLILEGYISQCLWRVPMRRETGEISYQSIISLRLSSAVPLKISFIVWHDKVMPSIFIIRGCVSLSGRAGWRATPTRSTQHLKQVEAGVPLYCLISIPAPAFSGSVYYHLSINCSWRFIM